MTPPPLDRIEQLRKKALPLEPDEQQRVQWREQVIRYTDAFLRSWPELPAVGATVDEGIGIVNSPISEEPMPIEEALELLERHVDPGENEVTTPGYLAFIPSGGLSDHDVSAHDLSSEFPIRGNGFIGTSSLTKGNS